MKEDIKQAISVLKNGGIVIFPTDTAFGIGCRIDDEEAIRRLFEIRRRPETKAMPILVSSLEMAQKYLDPIPENVIEKLVNKYWPGGLTIVLPCKKEKVPALVRGNGETLGVRMPNNKMCLGIIEKVGVPILASSANFAGEKTPYRFEDLDPELVKLVDYILRDSGPIRYPSTSLRQTRLPLREKTQGNQVSTVIDCTVNPWSVLREGAIKLNF